MIVSYLHFSCISLTLISFSSFLSFSFFVHARRSRATPSFKHKKVKHFIHAVGPVYPYSDKVKNPLKLMAELDALLESAYARSLAVARDLKLSKY